MNSVQEPATESATTEPQPDIRYGLYPTGRFCKLFAIPLIGLALVPLFPGLMFLAVMLNVVLVVGLVVDFLRSNQTRNIKIKRPLLQRLSLGVDNKIDIQLSSLAATPLDIRVYDDPPPTFTVQDSDVSIVLEPNDERTISYTVRPHRRGDYEFGDICVEVVGPWRLARRVYTFPQRRAVKVYPNLKGVEQWKLLTRKRHLAEIGVHKVRKRGDGGEFDQLRNYNRDDEFRSINWKATARRNKPITSVYQTERSQSVVVLLDAGRRMASWVGGLSKLDYAINASLLLAYVASVGDDNIALGVFNSDLRTWLAPKKGRMQYRRFMEQLYACEAELVYTNYRASFLQLARKITKRSLVVIMTDIMDPEGAAELEAAVSIFRPRHLPLVVSLRDPQLLEIAEQIPTQIDEVYQSVVAQEVFLERRALAREIQRRNVYTVDASPNDFSIAVVNEYLRLKASREL